MENAPTNLPILQHDLNQAVSKGGMSLHSEYCVLLPTALKEQVKPRKIYELISAEELKLWLSEKKLSERICSVSSLYELPFHQKV